MNIIRYVYIHNSYENKAQRWLYVQLFQRDYLFFIIIIIVIIIIVILIMIFIVLAIVFVVIQVLIIFVE
jgi:hypothetical protein